jgi:hypothetical protein
MGETTVYISTPYAGSTWGELIIRAEIGTSAAQIIAPVENSKAAPNLTLYSCVQYPTVANETWAVLYP